MHLTIQKLEELEREEALREEAGFYAVPKIELDSTLQDIKELAAQIRDKKAIMKQEARVRKASTKPVLPRTATPKVRERSVSRFRNELNKLGVALDNNEKVLDYIVGFDTIQKFWIFNYL